jgi:hypothetical protein
MVPQASGAGWFPRFLSYYDCASGKGNDLQSPAVGRRPKTRAEIRKACGVGFVLFHALKIQTWCIQRYCLSDLGHTPAMPPN